MKYQLVKENGGLALIEIVVFKDVPWEALVGYYVRFQDNIKRCHSNSQ
ncbi:MAG: hypothetical protein WDO15_15220 [Bacteroidota bacterium]